MTRSIASTLHPFDPTTLDVLDCALLRTNYYVLVYCFLSNKLSKTDMALLVLSNRHSVLELSTTPPAPVSQPNGDWTCPAITFSAVPQLLPALILAARPVFTLELSLAPLFLSDTSEGPLTTIGNVFCFLCPTPIPNQTTCELGRQSRYPNTICPSPPKLPVVSCNQVPTNSASSPI